MTRHVLLREAAVLASFLALALVQTGLGPQPDRRFFLGPDPIIDMAVLQAVGDNLWERPSQPFESRSYFPSHDAVLFTDPLLGPVALVAPLRPLLRNPVARYNAAVLLVLVLGSYASYRVARRFTSDAGAGLLAGVLIPYAPYLVDHFVHLNMLTVTGFPVLLWGMIELVERPGPRPAAITGLAFAFQAGTSGYYAFCCLFLCLLVAAWGWRGMLRPASLSGIAAAGILATALLLPYVFGFLRLREAGPAARSLGHNVYYSLDLARDLLGSRAYLWRELLPPGERPMFPGVLLPAFAAFAVWRRRDRVVGLLLLLVAFFLLVSLGPDLRWNGRSLTPLPFRALFQHLPLFNAGRHPNTYAVPAYVALGLLAAVGFAASGLSRRRLTCALVLAVALAESLVPPPRRYAPSQELPEVYAFLRTQPPGALLELPFEHESRPLWWSLFHGMPTVNGTAAFEPPEHIVLYKFIAREWDREGGLEETRALGYLKRHFPIRYLVVRPGTSYPVMRSIEATPASLVPIYRGKSGRAFQVRRGGRGRDLARRFRAEQLHAGPLRATLRGPVGASLVASLDGVPFARHGTDGTVQELALAVPGPLARRSLREVRLALEGEGEIELVDIQPADAAPGR
jgi:hypothetical protein